MVNVVSNWRGDMKLYFYVSRVLREGHFPFSLLPTRMGRLRIARLTLLLSLIFAISSPALSQQSSKQSSLESVPAAEFARMVREFSEEGGYFMSDNFTSNETSYLHVLDKLRELGVTGGAYIGVGPEQNFTYIAKIRPRIAFIIDIRRQAMIQHLMFKAIFHLSPTRLQYLSMLLSRPLTKETGTLPPDAQVTDILALISRVPPNDRAYEANLAAVR